MPSVSSSASFEFNGHTYSASGTCGYFGPHFEFEGVANLTIRRTAGGRIQGVDHLDALVQAAEEALDDEAQDQLREAMNDAYETYGNSDDDYRDYDLGHSSGPDYWVDRESGEYRCG
jgi:hypothetical protein